MIIGRYMILPAWKWGYCGFGFRRNFRKNLSAKLTFWWVLRLEFVEIRCLKNKKEQEEFFKNWQKKEATK
jgi:hypothetical protein